jgi:hypothetical protein
MPQAEIQSLLDVTAATVGAAIVLEDSDQRILAHTEHVGVIDQSRLNFILGRPITDAERDWFNQWARRADAGPVVVPPNPDIGVSAGRLGISVRYNGRHLAYMWLLVEATLDERKTRVAEAAAHDIGAVLYRQNQAAAVGGELLNRLLGSDADSQLAADELRVSGRLAPSSGVVVTVCGLADETQVTTRTSADLAYLAGQAASQFLPGRILTCTRVNNLIALTALRDNADLADLRRFIELISKAGGSVVGDLVFGLGTVVKLNDAKRSFETARRTHWILRAVPELGPTAHWKDLGVHRALALLPTGEAFEAADERVTVLLGDPTLARTAMTFLELAGNVQSTAAALHVHRATLYQRLDRIEELTGLDLRTNGDHRLVTHFGLKLARLLDPAAGSHPSCTSEHRKPYQ